VWEGVRAQFLDARARLKGALTPAPHVLHQARPFDSGILHARLARVPGRAERRLVKGRSKPRSKARQAREGKAGHASSFSAPPSVGHRPQRSRVWFACRPCTVSTALAFMPPADAPRWHRRARAGAPNAGPLTCRCPAERPSSLRGAPAGSIRCRGPASISHEERRGLGEAGGSDGASLIRMFMSWPNGPLLSNAVICFLPMLPRRAAPRCAPGPRARHWLGLTWGSFGCAAEPCPAQSPTRPRGRRPQAGPTARPGSRGGANRPQAGGPHQMRRRFLAARYRRRESRTGWATAWC
jgi:hypothetical protein